jgi:hypothetical protein
MRTFLILALLSLVLVLSACSTQSPAPTAVSDNFQMGSGDMDMSEPSGAATPTPGSMMPTNPEAAHMMEPIGGSNVQAATETKGGQPLAYREENGVKVFELTAKAVQWPILEGVTCHCMDLQWDCPRPNDPRHRGRPGADPGQE